MNDAKAILWLAIEDYSGLWEAAWQLQADHPDFDSTQTAKRAKSVVNELLERGFVRLYRCQEPYGELSVIDNGQVPEVLAEPANWNEPGPESISIRFSATPAGEEAIRSWA
ncbi:hypothetical protein [Arthrobacter celericrescens]|uniref:hypothetical protein n=1 Tax=Arthrobacter celericrescens TaxID=2320851 RepID=UPI0013C4F2BD|nr:hypothetical protein [Arthrobacter celericrescens]